MEVLSHLLSYDHTEPKRDNGKIKKDKRFSCCMMPLASLPSGDIDHQDLYD